MTKHTPHCTVCNRTDRLLPTCAENTWICERCDRGVRRQTKLAEFSQGMRELRLHFGDDVPQRS